MDKEMTKLIRDEVVKEVSFTLSELKKDMETLKMTVGRLVKELKTRMETLELENSRGTKLK